MALPTSESAIRALEAKCDSRTSRESLRTVKLLADLTLAKRKSFLFAFEDLNLTNLVRCALDADVSADARLDDKSTPVLVRAAAHDHSRSLKALLDGGAQCELKDAEGFTALHAAAHAGNLLSLQVLLEAGADANSQDVHNHTALMTALISDHVECVAALLPYLDATARNNDGWNVVHFAALVGSVPCFEVLRKSVRLADLNERVVSTGRESKDAGVGRAPLHLAVQGGPDIIRALIRAGANVDAPTTGNSAEKRGTTPLHLACDTGREASAAALLEGGASRMARDERGFIPLHLCARDGNLGLTLLLMGKPGERKMTAAQADSMDSSGHTPLILAAFKGYNEICAALLAAGARPDARSRAGTTPLSAARERHAGNAELIAMLSHPGPATPPQPGLPPLPTKDADLRALDAKVCDPSSADSLAVNAQMAALPTVGKKLVAMRYTDMDLGNLLRSVFIAGWPPNASYGPKSTPLLVSAAAKGLERALKALLAGGADVSAADSDGVNGVMAAAEMGQAACLRLLLEAGADAAAKDDARMTAMEFARRSKAAGRAECLRLLEEKEAVRS